MGPVLDQSLVSFRAFAARHDYDVVVGSGLTDPIRSPAWSKVQLITRLLESYHLVLWVDADAIILDQSEDPARVMDADVFQAMVKHRWLDFEQPCTGVWLLRSEERTRDFLDALWAYDGPYRLEHPWEQAALMLLLGYESVVPGRLGQPSRWWEGTQWLDLEWDRIPIIEPGRPLAPARIRHYAAVPNRVRRKQMQSDHHEIAAASTKGARRWWHRAVAAVGRARWRLVYAPEVAKKVESAASRLRRGSSSR